MDKAKLFFDNNADCPWYEEGQCVGTKELTGKHASYDSCEYLTCPIFHWIKVLAGELEEQNE